jgi:hypothetical protein
MHFYRHGARELYNEARKKREQNGRGLSCAGPLPAIYVGLLQAQHSTVPSIVRTLSESCL